MNPAEFAKRRRQLMRMIGRGGVGILPTALPRQRSRDVDYAYRPDSDFFYVTGFPEPEAIAVLAPGRPQGEFVLFCRERDPQRETWDGERAGTEGAVVLHGADDAFPIGDVDEILPGIIESADRIFYTMGAQPEFDARVIGWVTALRSRGGSGRHAPDEFVALDHLLHDLRLYKSRAELATMRRAAAVAVSAHRRAMAATRPGLHEYEIEAELHHEFRRHGMQPSYLPIVGSGPNACTLHYTANSRLLEDGDLLLVDAGCEHECYASDVTRTWPVNGRFKPAQRAVYEIVLAAHEAALRAIVPGNHWNDPHDAAVTVIARGLKKLGILDGTLPAIVRSGAYREFFMHRTGHWLGMDVHDVGDYKVGDQWRVLEPGMVMTVEPGIYVPAGTPGVPRRWQGIGVRIEDDVAVTADGHEVLTAGLPRDPDEIERLVGNAA
jgi:Xaa-Pro aminopeptidase